MTKNERLILLNVARSLSSVIGTLVAITESLPDEKKEEIKTKVDKAADQMNTALKFMEAEWIQNEQ